MDVKTPIAKRALFCGKLAQPRAQGRIVWSAALVGIFTFEPDWHDGLEMLLPPSPLDVRIIEAWRDRLQSDRPSTSLEGFTTMEFAALPKEGQASQRRRIGYPRLGLMAWHRSRAAAKASQHEMRDCLRGAVIIPSFCRLKRRPALLRRDMPSPCREPAFRRGRSLATFIAECRPAAYAVLLLHAALGDRPGDLVPVGEHPAPCA